MPPTPNIGAELQALPLGFLIGAPMKSAIEAQALAAQTTADFLNNVMLAEPSGGGSPEAVMVSFTYTQTVPDPQNPTSTVEQPMTLSVPLLAITQVPYLRINDLSVAFEFKIRDVQSVASQLKLASSTGATSSSSFKGSYAAGGGVAKFFGAPSVSASYQNDLKLTFNASVTYQRSERHETDRSATFKMNMNAVQDPIPEGMRRVLQILADTIRALTGTSTTSPPPPPPPSP